MQGHSNKKQLLKIIKQLNKDSNFNCSINKKNKLIVKSKINKKQYIVHTYCRDYKPLSRWLDKEYNFKLFI